MEKLKFKHFFILWIIISGNFYISCSGDDVPGSVIASPEIRNLEIGIGNNLIAYAGSDLHIEADLIADGLIQKVEVEIQKESGDLEFYNSYNEFLNQRNALFHKHINIPPNAEPGNYHFKFRLEDKLGNEVLEESIIEIKLIEDDQSPFIQVTSSPIENQSFAVGESISISGVVSDNTSLSELIITLVKSSDLIADEDISAEHPETIVLFYDDHLTDIDFYDFAGNISIGAETDAVSKFITWENEYYYLLIVVKDIVGNKSFSGHYPVEIIVN